MAAHYDSLRLTAWKRGQRDELKRLASTPRHANTRMATDELQVDRIGGVRLIINIQQYIGLWPWHGAQGPHGDGSYSWLKRNLRFLLHVPLTFTFISLMWLEALTSHDLGEVVEVLYMSITEVALVVKILNIWQYRFRAWRFLDELKSDAIYALRTHEEVEFWQRHQSYFKRLFYPYMLASLGVVSSACVSVLILDEYVLPFAYFVPFNWRSPHTYWYAYGYNVIAMTMTCISNITLDAIGCYFMLHIGLLYRLLGMRLEALNDKSERHALDELFRVFRLHRRVRLLTDTCQRLVSAYVLSQIILSAFIICFSGYRLQHVDIKANAGQFISMLQFVSVMILQIYLPCYYGNEVTVHSDRLTNMVYNTNWLEYSPRTRKILNLYMEFLKRPVKIRAGNFFEVGLPIFAKTINNAYSFFALLLNMSKE